MCKPAGAPIRNYHPMNCDHVWWLKDVLDRFESTVATARAFPGNNHHKDNVRLLEAAKVACILEIAEIMNGKLTNEAKENITALLLPELVNRDTYIERKPVGDQSAQGREVLEQSANQTQPEPKTRERYPKKDDGFSSSIATQE